MSENEINFTTLVEGEKNKRMNNNYLRKEEYHLRRRRRHRRRHRMRYCRRPVLIRLLRPRLQHRRSVGWCDVVVVQCWEVIHGDGGQELVERQQLVLHRHQQLEVEQLLYRQQQQQEHQVEQLLHRQQQQQHHQVVLYHQQQVQHQQYQQQHRHQQLLYHQQHQQQQQPEIDGV
jgi:hypothetical protein